MSSANSEKPTTSLTATTISLTTSTITTTTVTALPITVQTASHNAPAFVNMSVGELLQKQHRITVVTMPSSVHTSSSPVATMNRFPIKPDPNRGNKPGDLMRHMPPVVVNASPISMKKTIVDFVKPDAVGTESAQVLQSKPPNVVEAGVTAEQPSQGVASSQPAPILTPSQLDDLVRQIDPTSVLEDPVKEMLTDFVEDFVDQVIERSCKLAHHRGSEILETKDVEFVLQRYFNCPIFPKHDTGRTGNMVTVQKGPELAAHNQRMALIKKSLKKP